MTEEKFIKINKKFNHLITLNDLSDDAGLIDDESILSRIYKKNNNEIDKDLLGMLIIFNKHILNEEYEASQYMKLYILKRY